MNTEYTINLKLNFEEADCTKANSVRPVFTVRSTEYHKSITIPYRGGDSRSCDPFGKEVRIHIFHVLLFNHETTKSNPTINDTQTRTQIGKLILEINSIHLNLCKAGPSRHQRLKVSTSFLLYLREVSSQSSRCQKNKGK